MPDRRTRRGSAITRVTRFLRREGQRIVVGVIGGAIVIVGLVLLPLPGPGTLVVLAGLAILATQFAWAQELRDRARARARGLLERLRGGSDGEPDEGDGEGHGDAPDVDRRAAGDRSDVA